jgi:hypothetical protein
MRYFMEEIMKTKLKVWHLASVLLFATAIVLSAGQPAEGAQSYPGGLSAPQYPGSVRERFDNATGEGRAVFYTKDPIEKVQAFYVKTLGVSLPVSDGEGRYCRDAGAASGCVKLTSKPESQAFYMLNDDLKQAKMGLPVNEKFHAACQKYEYLSRSVFTLSDETTGAAGHPEMPDALYAKYVGPVEQELKMENEQESQAQKGRSAEGQADKEARKKQQEQMQQTAERIRQLQAEGKNDEAMALAMQMAQASQGAMAAGMAAASEAQAKVQKQKERLQQAYIAFLQELAKQPMYATKIVIDSSERRDYTSQKRDYTSQQRSEGKGPGMQDTINKLKGLFGR